MSTPRAYTRAFSSLGCVELTFDEILALALNYGLDAVELRGLDGSLDIPACLAQAYDSPEAFADHTRRSCVRVISFDTSLRLIGNTPADRHAFLQFIPWAEALGVPRLRIFDGGRKTLTDEDLAEALDTLVWWNSLRREKGWRTDLMIEAHDALVSTPAIRSFLAAAPSGTSLLWDAHHTWRKGGETFADTWGAIRDTVVHIHVKDSVTILSGGHPYAYVLPGQGEFPMSALLDILRRDSFTGPVSFEWERLWHPELPSLRDALTSASNNHWW